MSGSDGARLTRGQARVVRLSTAIIAGVLVVLIVAVGELFILRATSRAQARKLACYVVRYDGTDQTARDIRQEYGCPPPRPLPTPKAGPRRPPARTPVGSPEVSAAPSPAANRTPAAPRPSADITGAPRRPSSAAPMPSTPSPTASSGGILGGLLCDPAGLHVCVR